MCVWLRRSVGISSTIWMTSMLAQSTAKTFLKILPRPNDSLKRRTHTYDRTYMGWLRLVGSFKL